jgi:hypothetical protein
MTEIATATRPARITIPTDRNLAACAAEPGESRQFTAMNLAEVTFGCGGGRAYVTTTDGRCITRAFADATDGKVGAKHYLYPEMVRRAPLGRKKVPLAVTIADGRATRPTLKGSVEAHDLPESNVAFPPTEDLWANPAHVFDPSNKSITLNARLLAKMAEAIGKDGVVTIMFPVGDHKPATVVGPNGVGLLMLAGDEDSRKRAEGIYKGAFPMGKRFNG